MKLNCYSHLLSNYELGQLLDEELTETEKADLLEAESVCRKFMAWRLEDPEADQENAGAKAKLAAVLGKKPYAKN